MELPSSFPIIIGLGNPGSRYAHTYHNAGFLAVRAMGAALAKSLPETPPWQKRKTFRFKQFPKMVIAEPFIFMNESGNAVSEALAWFKHKPEEMLVVHDDSDIALGAYKLSFGRGAAGHRGVASAIAALGTNRFFRARIGVRARTGKAEKFVLARMPERHEELLYGAIDELIKNVITNA